MPIADAIADAETLRWFSYYLVGEANKVEAVRIQARNRNRYGHRRIMAPLPPSLDLHPIVEDLARADAGTLLSMAAVWNLIPDEVVRQAVNVAHAAFSAVPELRG